MSAHESQPEVLVTSPSGTVRHAAWMEPIHAQAVSAREIAARETLPPVLIVRTGDLKDAVGRRAFLDDLARKHSRDPRTTIVFSFDGKPGEGATAQQTMKALFRHFERHSDLDVAQGTSNTVIAVWAALAKLTLAGGSPERGEQEGRSGRPADPLRDVRRVLAATADLRAESGRLDAGKIAGALGISVAALAVLLGKHRQTVSKTPDAAPLQEALAPYERIVRLRAVLPPEQFRSWLNAANPQLEGRTPIGVVLDGRAEVVADLVEDLLTGVPA